MTTMLNFVQITMLQKINKIAILFLLLIATLSCNKSSNKNNTQIKNITKTVNHKKIQKTKNKKIVALTDKNIEKELLKYGKENKETLVLLKTKKGDMKIKLYTNTPLHRANFIRLIKNDFYKGTMFYRVVNHFMIQGGDNDDWSRQSIKNKMGNYTIPAEFRKDNIHKKGAVSMAREYENNPNKRSVSFEFFIVQGTKYTEGELLGAEQEYGIKISSKHKKIYQTVGGTPHLDGQHTVFGQVIEGLNVIDSIAKVKVDDGDWPIEDIVINLEILK